LKNPPEELQRQLEQLQAELATRSSILRFAQAGVAMICSLIVAGAAGKLSWDSPNYYWIGLSVGSIAVGLWLYGLACYRRGKRLLAQEIERFEMLKSLRRTLGVDDPSALLPQ
jgi:hypothetical protein